MEGEQLRIRRRRSRSRRLWLWASSSFATLLLMLGLIGLYSERIQEEPLGLRIELENPVRSASEDEVRVLPDSHQFKPSFRHYSGYLEADDAGNRFWHYWFTESQSDPARDPLVLWLNGGPGCSSLAGLLNELGPFRIDQAGLVRENPHAWNKRANVIFLETPAGVGFSYALDGSLDADDHTTAEQNHRALRSFFRKFPQFRARALFLTGESYASVYLSTLSLLLDRDSEINLRGLAIGNGCLEGIYYRTSLIFFAYYRGLLGHEKWDNFSSLCCNGLEPSHKACKDLINSYNNEQGDPCRQFVFNTARSLLNGDLNIYALYANCDHSNDGRKVPICISNSTFVDYLNRLDVRRALHLPGAKLDKHKFAICNFEFENNYRSVYANGLAHLFRQLLGLSRKLRLLVYNGDNDMLCNHLGDDWFVRGLNRTLVGEHRAWFLGDQVAGFSKQYQGITFATVKGAGHMVPSDRPAEALHLFHEFITPNSSLFSRV